tara:strand:+ start:653 stop:2131 length:1479 start_codon:yes stop_codon:yes gene_type:complete
MASAVRSWTFHGLRAPSTADEEGDALQRTDTHAASTGGLFTDVAITRSATWTSGCFGIVVAVICVVGGAIAAVIAVVVSGANSAASLTAEQLPVKVRPLAVYPTAPSGSRSLSEVSGEKCPGRASEITCQKQDGTTLDLGADGTLAFAYTFGHGYVGAYEKCSMYPGALTPYRLSHNGGIMDDFYDHLNNTEQIDGVLRDIPKLSKYADLYHDSSIGYTCGDDGYLADAEHYTCGLQELSATLTFTGSACKMIMDNELHAGKVSHEDGQRTFRTDSGLSEYFTDMRLECLSQLGSLPLFEALKKYVQLDVLDAWIELSIPYTLPQSRPLGYYPVLNPATIKKVYNVMLDADEPCTVTMVLAIGSPTCDSPVITHNAQLRDVSNGYGVDVDERKHYALDRYGFELSNLTDDGSNSLWHRKGANEDGQCALGCCDECFQWFCTAPDDCQTFTYECRNGGFSTDFYGTSDQMVCGERTTTGQSGDTYEYADRRMC